MARESAEEKLLRMTRIERPFWREGLRVAGIDEVGRGPLAGPVVTACVILPEDRLIPGVDDSKKLSEKRREALYEELSRRATYVGVARLEAGDIDRINILQATRLCMESCARKAVGALFLVDAASYMIAAASIIAKVTRDRWMVEQDALYPQYGFARNKGYGTAEHIAALKRYGPCPLHRRSFITKFL
jgi:ribonuclease HII